MTPFGTAQPTDADRAHSLALQLILAGQAGTDLPAHVVLQLGEFLRRMALQARRMERTLDELVAEAQAEEAARYAQARHTRIVAAIVAGISMFREPSHPHLKEDNDHDI